MAGAVAFVVGGCSSGNDNGTVSVPSPTPTPTPTPSPAPVQSAYILATRDGSVGQTYSVAADLTQVQWFRESLTADRTRTPITDATGTSYVARAADIGSRIVARGRSATAEIDARALAVVLPLPIVLESFDDVATLAVGNEAIASADTERDLQGRGAIDLRGTGSNLGGPKIGKADIGTHDPAGFGTIAQFVHLGWDPVYSSVSSVTLSFARGDASYPSEPPFLGPLYITPRPIFYGAAWGSRHVSEFGALATIGAGPLSFETAFLGQAPNAPTVAVDALLAKAGGRPTVILGFDDMVDNQYDLAFQYLRAKNLKAGIHLIPNRVGAEGRLSLVQIREMYAAGWDCYLNATPDDGPINVQSSVAAAVQGVNDVRAWAVAQGLPRGNDFICYPNGVYQTTAARTLVYSVRTDGTNVATMNSTAGIVAGMVAGGYNVPANTTVASVGSDTQITLSNPVVTQTKPYSFTNAGSAFGYTLLPLALKAAGYKMARTTQGRGGFLSRFGIGDRGGILTPCNPTSSLTLEELQAEVDLCILRGETMEFYTHGISAAGGVQTDSAKFTALIDYIAAKRDAGLLDVLTKTELWMRDGNASVPV